MNNETREYRNLNFFPSNIYLLLYMYPLFVRSYSQKGTFQKIHCMCHCYYCSGISPSQRKRSPLAKTILIPTHSTLLFSRNSRARMRFALTFAITLTWSRHRSSREKWRHRISALTAFPHFSGRSHFPRHFCLLVHFAKWRHVASSSLFLFFNGRVY